MDWVSARETGVEWIKKYRYVLLVLLVGLTLMALPEGKEQESPAPVQTQPREQSLQQQLETLLAHLEGAGKVKVLLTQSAGEQVLYQTDEDRTSDSIRRETVIVTDSGRGEAGLVCQTLPPVYLGAVVLCQGADSAGVRLAVIEAVSRATGLGTHNIAVLKMK